MSVKTVEGYSGPDVVSERLISRVIRVDRPLDSGGDYEIEGPMQPAVSPAIVETAQKLVSHGVSYAGETPTVPDSPEPGFKPFPTLP